MAGEAEDEDGEEELLMKGEGRLALLLLREYWREGVRRGERNAPGDREGPG